jgi:hypothetical protein
MQSYRIPLFLLFRVLSYFIITRNKLLIKHLSILLHIFVEINYLLIETNH